MILAYASLLLLLYRPPDHRPDGAESELSQPFFQLPDPYINELLRVVFRLETTSSRLRN